MTTAPDSKATRSIVLIALVLATAYAFCFYPGAMSADSADAWWMARGGASNNVHGMGLMWLWRLTDPILAGPGPIFLIQLGLFWGALTAIACSTYSRLMPRLIFVLACSTAPVIFVMFTHVWSDVSMMAALLATIACLLRYRSTRHWVWLGTALLLATWSLTLRHNALPAVLPLFLYAAALWCSRDGAARTNSNSRNIIVCVIAAAAMFGASAFIDRNVDQRISALPTLTLWDLAAISLKTGEVLLPPDTHAPTLVLDDLRDSFEPFSNVSIFVRTRGGIHQPFLEPGEPMNAEIDAAWLSAITRHPGAYLSHRWRLTRALFGSHKADWPRELVFVDGQTAYKTNPPVTPNTTAAHRFWIETFESLRSSSLFAAWPYLVLSLIAGVVAWHRRHSTQGAISLATLASGLMYAAPLPLVAPSAELRYVAWTCLAGLVGAAMAFAAPRATVRDANATDRAIETASTR